MKSIHENMFFQSVFAKSNQRRRPSTAFFELTYGCNFRCVHCYNPTHRVGPNELATEEVFSILEQIAAMGVLFVKFTGGELLLRKDIFQIIGKAAKLGLLIEILTNASLINKETVRHLEALGVLAVNVSVYGATEETFEKVTKTKGSFTKFKNGLDALQKSSMSTCVRMPLLTTNVHEWKQAKSMIESMGFAFRIFTEIEPGQNGNYDTLRYRLAPDQQMQVLRESEPMSLTQPKTEEPHDFISCACGKERFAVTAYGEMNLCVSFPYPKYDLRKGSVEQGWKVLQETVECANAEAANPCSNCDLHAFCHQGRADAYLETEDMSACLPYFKEWARLQKKEYLAYIAS